MLSLYVYFFDLLLVATKKVGNPEKRSQVMKKQEEIIRGSSGRALAGATKINLCSWDKNDKLPQGILLFYSFYFYENSSPYFAAGWEEEVGGFQCILLMFLFEQFTNFLLVSSKMKFSKFLIFPNYL